MLRQLFETQDYGEIRKLVFPTRDINLGEKHENSTEGDDYD